LASTIQPDPTAPHYKYHDDPYLTPLSNVGKRSFALSKECGRKAAHWIRAQDPELFQHKVAFPPVQVISYFYIVIIYNVCFILSHTCENDCNLFKMQGCW